MDIDHPTPSAPRLPVEVAVPPADPNHVTEGRDDEPVTPDLSCPFCKWEDEEVGLRKRDYEFARPDSLGRHIRDQHLAERDANKGFDCPNERCSAFLGGAMHFLNHIARQHGLTFWCAIRR